MQSPFAPWPSAPTAETLRLGVSRPTSFFCGIWGRPPFLLRSCPTLNKGRQDEEAFLGGRPSAPTAGPSLRLTGFGAVRLVGLGPSRLPLPESSRPQLYKDRSSDVLIESPFSPDGKTLASGGN